MPNTGPRLLAAMLAGTILASSAVTAPAAAQPGGRAAAVQDAAPEVTFETKAAFPALVRPMETRAVAAVVLDAETGTVLLEKGPDERRAPASLTKIMTMYLVFEALEQGRLSLKDEITISKKAWQTGGSQTYLEVGKQVKVEDLIRGAIIQSGNDACVALAEHLAGSEEAFALAMTAKAAELGMGNTGFQNATGFDGPGHHTTARDLAVLARALVQRFPQHYGYYSEREFTFNGITQPNRNPLLGRDPSADGMKTGYTRESGYGLVASAQRDGRRVISVTLGHPSIRARGEDAGRLVDWAFREYDLVELPGAGPLAKVSVAGGLERSVAARPGSGFKAIVPAALAGKVGTAVTLVEGLEAPVAAGQEVGRVTVSVPGVVEPRDIPLVADAAVPRLSLWQRAVRWYEDL